MPLEQDMRFGQVSALYMACLLALISTGAYAGASSAAPTLTCNVVPPPAVVGTKSWDDDDNYSLTSRTVNGSVSIRVTADIVRINDANFHSLVREIDKAVPNVSEVIVDARKIVIDGPLSFESSHLVFLGDEIDFGPSGRISLTSAPRGTNDGLRLIARSVSFDDGARKPIQFVPSAAPQRRIDIVASEVRANGQVLVGDAASTALWRHTLGSYFGGPPTDGSWIATTDSSAVQGWQEAFSKEMFWPLYTSAKLDKFHSRAPYDPENQTKLISLIAALKPRFEAWSNPQPLIELQRISNLIRLDLDPYGRSAAYAPRVAIQKQIDNVRTRLTEAAKPNGTFATLTTLIVAANERKQVDADAVRTVSAQIDQGTSTAAALESQIGQSLERIAELKQDVEALVPTIQQRRATIAQETEDDAKRASDAAKVKVGANVLATGVAIGCMFIPGAQPAGIAIATGIQVTGGLVYANNSGGINAATIAEVVSKGADFYSKMTVISSSWEKFKAQTSQADQVLKGAVVLVGDAPKPGEQDKRKPMSKVDATKQWGDAASGFASSVDAAYKLLDVAKPTSISGTDREKTDGELNELLSQLGAYNKEASDLASTISADSDLLTVTLAKQHEAIEQRTELLTASVVNDEETERWRANSLALWSQYVSRILEDVLTLRRSYFFETGKLPNVPSDVLQYPDELAAFMRANAYDPTGSGTSMPPDLLRAHLESERDKFLVSMTAIVDAVDDGKEKALSQRTEADVYRQTFAFRSNSSDPIERRFIETLNSQIAQQIGFRRDARDLPALVLPLELPVTIAPYPERFVDAKVTLVRFKSGTANLHGSGLTFTVLHPGYGRVYRDNVCYMFDLREPGSINSIAKTTSISAVDPNWAKAPSPKIDISSTGSFYTYYPARSPLSLATVVSGKNWKSVPEIAEIDIGLEIMQ